MRPIDIIKKYTDEEILEDLYEYHKLIGNEFAKEDIVNCYTRTLAELRTLKPAMNSVRLRADKYKEGDGISIVLTNGRQDYAIGSNWGSGWDKDVLLDPDLVGVKELRLLSAIIWELTYSGYTQAEVEEYFSRMFAATNTARNVSELKAMSDEEFTAWLGFGVEIPNEIRQYILDTAVKAFENEENKEIQMTNMGFYDIFMTILKTLKHESE